jgi:diguanylate cyclase (GGDEF)-like protein/PAS domain S-box-containing protein
MMGVTVLSATFLEILEGAADAIVAADADGRIVLWNDAAEELFGYTRESMLGGTVAKLIPERYLRDYEKGVAAAFAAGRPSVTHLNTVARSADGSEYPVEAAVSIAGSGEGAVAVGIVRRVDDRFKKLALLRESERLLRDAEQLAGMGSFEWNVGSDEIGWSDQLSRIYGYEPDDHPKKLDQFLDRVHPDDRAGLQNNIRNALETGSAWSMDERIIRASDGAERILASRVKALKNAEGRVNRLVGICHDVTDQRRAEEALAASETRFRRIFDDAPIGMLLVDAKADEAFIARTNKALARLLGYNNGEFSQKRLSELVDPADRPLLRAMLQRAATESARQAHLEIRLRAKDGTMPTVLAAVSRIGDGEGTGATLIVHFEDISLRKHIEAQLRHRALHDPLTGLPNRDLLLDRLNGALARAARAKGRVGVLFLNLDNFKIINDTIGHVAGDEILKTVAERLVAAARGADTLARLGGDEFAIVCENADSDEEIAAFARRVASALSVPIAVSGKEFITTASIGIAVGHEPGAPEQLLRDADLAMFHAKQHGKNTAEVFDETLRRHAVDRVEVERDLRRALQAGEIEPYYQPIVEIATGAIAGFEALARWRHPDRGVLLPAQFLSIAEESHLIGTLGETMLHKACAQLAKWQKQLPELTMAVNLSALQLNGGLPSIVEQVVAQCTAPRSLLVEITESVFLDMKGPAAAHLNALARLGVQLGIDDFGTGYSSLLYLKRFPVRFLKIDRSFVSGLPGDSEDAAIVESIVRLGTSLELATVAEGVETAEQFGVLRAMGCTYAQGYYIAPPRPAAECTLGIDGHRG